MKMAKSVPDGSKALWEKEKCLRGAISPFPPVFSKELYCRHEKSGLVWERVKVPSTTCFQGPLYPMRLQSRFIPILNLHSQVFSKYSKA